MYLCDFTQLSSVTDFHDSQNVIEKENRLGKCSNTAGCAQFNRILHSNQFVTGKKTHVFIARLIIN